MGVWQQPPVERIRANTVSNWAEEAGYPCTERGYRVAKARLALAEDFLSDASDEDDLRKEIEELQNFVWSWEQENRS